MTDVRTASLFGKLTWSRVEFKIESSLLRAAYRASQRKPSSAPYLSGDGFRSLCRFFYENGTDAELDPESVRPGDLVFCDAWKLSDFLRGPALEIRHPFSIISHNGDPNIDQSITRLIPPNVRRLFAQNALAADDRLIGLPIGLENKRLHYNGITRDFDRLRRQETKKRPSILSAFTVGNNRPVRQKAVQDLSVSAFNDFIPRTDSRSYRKIAAKYMFISSPPGNGADCHRTWEAMYLGSVPIVLRSALMESFKKHGLPLFIVDSYEEVARLGEGELCSIYNSLVPFMNAKSLWFSYWENLIRREAAWDG